MRRAPTIKLDIPVRKELERLSRSRSVAVRLAERSRIVLLAAGGLDSGDRCQVTDVGAIVSLKMASGESKRTLPAVDGFPRSLRGRTFLGHYDHSMLWVYSA